MKIVKRKVPLFSDWTFKVFYTGDFTEVEKNLNIEFEGNIGVAISFEDISRNPCVAINPNRLTNGIISHECKHAVNIMMKNVGAKLDLNNDELECYLLEWMVNIVHDHMPEIK